MMIYEMPWVLNAVWKLIKQLLSDEQQKFVIFAKKSEVDKYIARDQLLVHMGGTVSGIHLYHVSHFAAVKLLYGQEFCRFFYFRSLIIA